MWGVGGLGAHAVQLLRAIGAAPIVAIAPLEAARSRALEFGADLALDAKAPDIRDRIKQITGGRGLDLAFDMAGVPAVRDQALRSSLALGGRLVLVGLTPAALKLEDSIAFSYRQQQFLGHYGSEPEHVEQFVTLARTHRLDFSRSISGKLSLADAADGVERLRQKQGNPIRLVSCPDNLAQGLARRVTPSRPGGSRVLSGPRRPIGACLSACEPARAAWRR